VALGLLAGRHDELGRARTQTINRIHRGLVAGHDSEDMQAVGWPAAPARVLRGMPVTRNSHRELVAPSEDRLPRPGTEWDSFMKVWMWFLTAPAQLTPVWPTLLCLGPVSPS
jgi:hypothetical protein